MTEFIITKTDKKPKLKKPILIEGLPGIGNVARIVVDFLITKLKAKKYATIHSHHFPNSVLINEDKTVELPKVDFYYYKSKKKTEKDIVFVIGDVQPADEISSYKFSKYLIDIAADLGVKEVITLGGINAQHSAKKPSVFGAVTDKGYIPRLKKVGVRFDREGSIIIVGAAGLMLSFGKLKKINGFALLSETISGPRALGLHAAESILEALTKYLNMRISLKDIRSDIKTMTTGVPSKKRRVLKKKLMEKFSTPQESTNTHYIG
jgi:uncharacterized protein (TIGR00162 family)